MMEPVELPVLPSTQEGVNYLLLPGFEEDQVQGVEFQVDWDRAVLNVFLYENQNREEEIEGIRIPVLIDQNITKRIQDMETLYVVEPRQISPGKVGEDDYLQLKRQFKQWKERRTR